MIRTYKRKLILTKAQEARIMSWIGACRVVYNLALEVRIAHYKATGKSLHKYELMKQCTGLRADIEWINDVPCSSLNMVIEKLDNAYKSFFRGAGFPKWGNKRKFVSMPFRQGRTTGIRVSGNKITLPKIGNLKMLKDAPIAGNIKTAIIKIEPTGFFICIQCDNVPAKFVSESQAVGIDMGLSHFAVDSNGEFIANPKHFKKYERQLRIENRSLARKKKGSKGWKKQAKKLGLLHHKIGNIRKDFLHKESTKIAKANSVVYMEDLNIKGMSKNRNLAKHILDAGWGMFGTMIAYKTTRVGVPAKHSSQECNECGNIDASNRKSQSVFECTKCGNKDNADFNAAKVIRGRGTTIDRQRKAIA